MLNSLFPLITNPLSLIFYFSAHFRRKCVCYSCDTAREESTKCCKLSRKSKVQHENFPTTPQQQSIVLYCALPFCVVLCELSSIPQVKNFFFSLYKFAQILSLAVADLLVACLVMPLSAVYEISREWKLGPELCDMWTSSDVLCCTASILHLVAIALDR